MDDLLVVVPCDTVQTVHDGLQVVVDVATKLDLLLLDLTHDDVRAVTVEDQLDFERRACGERRVARRFPQITDPLLGSLCLLWGVDRARVAVEAWPLLRVRLAVYEECVLPYARSTSFTNSCS